MEIDIDPEKLTLTMTAECPAERFRFGETFNEFSKCDGNVDVSFSFSKNTVSFHFRIRSDNPLSRLVYVVQAHPPGGNPSSYIVAAFYDVKAADEHARLCESWVAAVQNWTPEMRRDAISPYDARCRGDLTMYTVTTLEVS